MLLKHATWSLALTLLVSGEAAAQPTVTKLINNGPDPARIVLVVLGEGYAAADQKKFADDTDAMIVKGLLGFPLYAQYTSAFNVYRVDLISKDSGISDDSSTKDTALQIRYVGGSCYFDESNATVTLLDHAMKAAHLSDTFNVLVLLNDGRYGGCSRQNKRFYISTNVGDETIAHEYGHVLAGLYDEYPDELHTRVFAGSLNERNCSNETHLQNLAWKGYVAANTPLPTTNGTAALGMFEGCNRFSKGLYKPTKSCLMLSLKHQGFCPVCKDLLAKELMAHQGAAPPSISMLQTPARGAQPAGRGAQPAQPVRYVDLLVRVFQNGTLQVLDASEETGTPPTSAAGTSDWFYEVESAGVPLSVSGLPAAAFEQRGYGTGDTTVHTTTAASATMHLRVPATTLNQLADRQLQLNVYRANQPIVANQNLEILRPAQVAPGMLQGLLQQRTVVRLPAAPAGSLGTAIRTYENTR